MHILEMQDSHFLLVFFFRMYFDVFSWRQIIQVQIVEIDTEFSLEESKVDNETSCVFNDTFRVPRARGRSQRVSQTLTFLRTSEPWKSQDVPLHETNSRLCHCTELLSVLMEQG